VNSGVTIGKFKPSDMFPIMYGIDSIRQVFRQSSEYKRDHRVSESVPIRRNNRDMGSTTDCISVIAGKADEAVNSDKSQPFAGKRFHNKDRYRSLIKQGTNL